MTASRLISHYAESIVQLKMWDGQMFGKYLPSWELIQVIICLMDYAIEKQRFLGQYQTNQLFVVVKGINCS